MEQFKQLWACYSKRYEVKNFTVDMDSELHGFGGYFECTLYKDVMISITPQTHSPGMFFNITRSSESEVDKIKIY